MKRGFRTVQQSTSFEGEACGLSAGSMALARAGNEFV